MVKWQGTAQYCTVIRKHSLADCLLNSGACLHRCKKLCGRLAKLLSSSRKTRTSFERFRSGHIVGGLMAKKAQSVSRRSFVGLITGAAAATVIAPPVMAQRSGVTDSDTGRRRRSVWQRSWRGCHRFRHRFETVDCGGRGRGSTTGTTDSDSGGSSDPGGNGRTGRTDSDPSDSAGLWPWSRQLRIVSV